MPADIDIEKDRDWLDRLLNTLQVEEFYGDMVLKFQNGRIVQVLKNESLVPPTRQ